MKLHLDQLVVTNSELDATVFRVHILNDPLEVGLIDATLDRANQRVRWVDYSLCLPLTAAQSDRYLKATNAT